ncbi:MAG: hypothetical protein MUP44_04965, partial [Anaerolineales bacterium]|nr:hypothetical protein [Anaerolineales bacterium]
VSRLLRRRPRRPASNRSESKKDKGNVRVWTLKDGNPFAIPVTIGLTDGQMTEVLAGDIEPGMELLVGIEESSQ